jgi:uncharacterized protein
MTAALAPTLVLGVLIGAALGLLGGGGSVLTVPLFVYALGFDPKHAIAMSLAVVGATSAFGTAAHWRAGNVNVRIAATFGAIAIAGTYVGVRLANFVSGTTQLVVFGAVMLMAAIFTLKGAPPSERDRELSQERGVSLLKAVPAGLMVGLLTGLLGVGGGFMIVPALLVLRASFGEAVGTSLLIITANCFVGFLGYLGHVSMDWTAVIFVSAGTVPGIVLGSYLHHFIPQSMLRRAFAAVLVVLAIFILYENLAPLSATSPIGNR